MTPSGHRETVFVNAKCGANKNPWTGATNLSFPEDEGLNWPTCAPVSGLNLRSRIFRDESTATESRGAAVGMLAY